ncbi:MAG: hypothetical protein ACRDP6_45070 [Actinoallomurus sp.]
MTRLESSAWSLAAGAACVLALAVVLDRLPWGAAFVAVTCAVAFWAWLSPPVAGAAIGAIAWLCVTGFDVHRFGEIRITGSEDALRAAVLILAGVLVASVHALAEARSGRRRPDPVWVDFHLTEAGDGAPGRHASRTPGSASARRGAARAVASRTPDRGTE